MLEADTHAQADAMIEWLAKNDPDTWFVITQELNWDTSHRVLDWIISQPRCDKANAAWVFWAADPAYYAGRIAAGVTPTGDGYLLMQKVLKLWRTGFYKRAELDWEEVDGAIERYEALSLVNRFSIPEDLCGPFDGRQPLAPSASRPREGVAPYDLLCALGVQLEPKPGSEAFRLRVNHDDWKAQERERLAIAGNSALVYWGSQAGWLGLLGLFAAGTFYALHRAAVF